MPNLAPLARRPIRAAAAPYSLAGEASARTHGVDAGEPYPPLSGRPQDGIGTSLWIKNALHRARRGPRWSLSK